MNIFCPGAVLSGAKDFTDGNRKREHSAAEEHVSGHILDRQIRKARRECQSMRIEPGVWTAPSRWIAHRPGAGRDGGLPAWRLSYNRWALGNASLAEIAADHLTGKRVKITAIFEHMRAALLEGMPVDMRKLFDEAGIELPNADVWDEIDAAAIKFDNDPRDQAFKIKPVVQELQLVMPDVAAHRLYSYVDTWLLLRRVQYPVAFINSSSQNHDENISIPSNADDHQ